MKKTIWIIIAIVIIGIIIWAVAGSSKNGANTNGAASSTATIKIGAVLSLSGDAAQDGESIKRGLDMAQADLKKQGTNVEIVYQDDKTDGKDTVSAINELATENVQAIIGPTWSFLADAGVPAADRLGLVTVMPANTSEYVESKSPLAFFTTTRVEHIVPSLAKWFTDNNIKTIAVIRNQGAWYEVVNKALTEAAAQSGSKIVSSDTVLFGAEASAMPTLLAKANAYKPDLLFTEIDSDQGITVMLKKLNELKIKSNVMSVTTSVGRVLATSGIKLSNGNKFYVVLPQSSADFNAKYKGVYNEDPHAYADRSYDSLMLLVDAIQKKGTTPLADYLRNTTSYKGYAGTYDFDANGDIVGGEWLVKQLQ